MSTATADVDLARTVTGVIAGAVVAVVIFALVIVIYMFRERALYTRINEQNSKIESMHKVMESRLKIGGNQFESLEDLLKPYKKHLLQSAFDLQSRLSGQLGTNTIFAFKHTRKEEDGDYMIVSTVYFFAEFLGWMEVIRGKIVFITGSAYAEALNALFDSIRFMFTGETPIQGVEEKNQCILQLFIVDIRSIGNAMLTTVDAFHRPITVDVFLRRLKRAADLEAAAAEDKLDRLTSRRLTEANEIIGTVRQTSGAYRQVKVSGENADSEEGVDVIAFKKIIEPLKKHVVRLSNLCEKSHHDKLKAKIAAEIHDEAENKNIPNPVKEWTEAMEPPKRRLAILQVLLNRLISILDDAVPWDAGPKFDPNEEPQYLQRSMLITPQVKFLSDAQKDYLRKELYFKDDPNFSFRGFRVDKATLSQAARDKEFWPGAFPPMEPRARPDYFKRQLPTLGADATSNVPLNTQGLATSGAQQRNINVRRRKALRDAKEEFPLNIAVDDDATPPQPPRPVKQVPVDQGRARAAVSGIAQVFGALNTFSRASPSHGNKIAPEPSPSSLKKEGGGGRGGGGSVGFADEQRPPSNLSKASDAQGLTNDPSAKAQAGFKVTEALSGLTATTTSQDASSGATSSTQPATSQPATMASQPTTSQPMTPFAVPLRSSSQLDPNPDSPPARPSNPPTDPSHPSAYIGTPPPLSPGDYTTPSPGQLQVEEGGRQGGVASPVRSRAKSTLPPLPGTQKRGGDLV